MSDAIAVIGSGPAGVSAARPLVEANLPVTLIDAGVEPSSSIPPTRPTLAALRSGDPDAWRYLVGEDLRGMRLMPELSPKLRIAAEPENFTAFAAANAIRTDNFLAIGCLAPGGLSNVWGAVTFAYDRADMAGWPIGPAELAASYRRISARIGISGVDIDELDREVPSLVLQEPLPLSPLETRIAAAFGRRRSSEFRLGRSRMAVLSADHRGRKACTLDNACMLGCAQGSIYASTQEMLEISHAPNVTLERGFVVERLQRENSGWTIRGRDRHSGKPREFKAAKVILAAGALASARLGLDAAGFAGEAVRLENSPGIAFAVLFPSALGTTVPARAFGLTQLSFSLPLASGDPADEIIGSLYPAGAMSATEFLARMPATRPGGIGLLREMTPALMIALAFFPGRYSDNRARLLQGADGISQLAIEGGQVAGFPGVARATFRRLRRHFLRLGGLVLLGSLQIMQPGADVHYAGPLAMGTRSDRLGEVNGAPGLHVVDGAALPTMAARNPTLTIMANADRIGAALATVWRR
jgi:choline dehydrogenase-like flavoprotein